MAPTNIVLNGGSERKFFKFPYDINEVTPEVNRGLLQDFTGERTGFVQVGPKKYFFPMKYRQDAEQIYNFRARRDDIWVATFPRSGTTWTQEMVWLIANDLNFEKAAEAPLLSRFPFLEYSTFVHKDVKTELLKENSSDSLKMKIVQEMDTPMWLEFEKTNGRRFIKTHMPFSLLPPDLLQSGCKVIYVARHPKDVAISFYHLNKFMRTQGYQNDWPTYWNYFKNNLQPWTPYWEHVKEAWEIKTDPNLLFLFYEDMNKNLRQSMRQVAVFLGKSLTDGQLDKLEEHLDIKNFRRNPSVNFDLLTSVGVAVKGEQAFIRQGTSGTWTSQFDDELNAQADRWIADNLEGTDIKFPIVR